MLFKSGFFFSKPGSLENFTEFSIKKEFSKPYGIFVIWCSVNGLDGFLLLLDD